jgi:hypothetical protein
MFLFVREGNRGLIVADRFSPEPVWLTDHKSCYPVGLTDNVIVTSRPCETGIASDGIYREQGNGGGMPVRIPGIITACF